MQATTDQQKRAKLVEIVNHSKTAFMVTRTSGDGLHGRPMANAEVAEDFEFIYFATQRDSGKVHEFQSDDRVYLGYTNASGSEWASINGKARLVDDRAKIQELWSPIWKNWFTGPDDPNLVLIEVTPESAEYWDTGNKLVAMFKFAAAAVTGKHMDEGEHETIDLAGKR